MQKSFFVFLASMMIGPQFGCVNDYETGSEESEIYIFRADAGSVSIDEDGVERDAKLDRPDGDDGGLERVCILDSNGIYSGDDCPDGKCKGEIISGEDTCGDLVALPSCEYLRQHNESVENYNGGKWMEPVPNHAAAFNHYETEYTRKPFRKQVLKLSSTSITAASLAVDSANAANLKLCRSTGTCAVDPLKVASPVGKKIATGLSIAGKAASAATAVLYAVDVHKKLNDNSCTVVIKKFHKVFEAEAKTIFTSACAEDGEEERECNVCGDTEAQTSSEPVKSLSLNDKGELWKDEDMVNRTCNAYWVKERQCGGRQGRSGWCFRASCGTSTPIVFWLTLRDAWNVYAAYNVARQRACDAWSNEIQDLY